MRGWQLQVGRARRKIDGEQYIAVQAGSGIDAQRMQSGVDALLGNKTLVLQGGVLTVFKLAK